MRWACVLAALGLLACSHKREIPNELPADTDMEALARTMGAVAPTAILFKCDVSERYVLTGVRVDADGGVMVDYDKPRGLKREGPAFDGKFVEGPHTLTVEFVYEDRSNTCTSPVHTTKSVTF